MDETRPPWEPYFDTLVRQRRLIGAIALAGCLVAAVVATLRAPVFDATALLMVSSDRPRLAVSPDPKTSPVLDRVTEQDLRSEAALLQSPTLIRAVLIDRGAADPPADVGFLRRFINGVTALPSVAYRWLHELPQLTPLDTAVSDVASAVSVLPVQGSNLISLTYRGSDARDVADWANALATAHVERRVRMNTEVDTQRFFSQQRQLLTEKVGAADAALREFQEREGIRPLPDENTSLRFQGGEIDSALRRTNLELAEATARAEFLRQEMRSHSRTEAPADAAGANDPIQLIVARLVDLELQHSALADTFAPGSERLGQIDRQMARARGLLEREKRRRGGLNGSANKTYQYLELNLAQTSAIHATLTARRGVLLKQREEIDQRLAHLGGVWAEGERLQRQLALAKESLHSYIRKEEEARFSSALDESGIVNVAVVEWASVPFVPVSNGLVTFALGALLSLLAAVAVAFARDRLDPLVQSAGDARSSAGLPVLAEVWPD